MYSCFDRLNIRDRSHLFFFLTYKAYRYLNDVIIKQAQSLFSSHSYSIMRIWLFVTLIACLLTVIKLSCKFYFYVDIIYIKNEIMIYKPEEKMCCLYWVFVVFIFKITSIKVKLDNFIYNYKLHICNLCIPKNW